MKILRTFSAAGPCITEGRVVGETPLFWLYQKWRGGDSYDEKVERMKKKRLGLPHIDPCHSCRDHEKTQYPNGYMD